MKYLDQIPLIGILRGARTEAVETAVAGAVRAGLKTLEITLSRPEAYDQIALIKSRYGGELELGAGTVLTPDAAEWALEAGAEFIVTPTLLPDVIDFCRRRQTPVFPGAMTPTEILAASQAGATMVKVFPAGSLGPAYVKSLKGPFPEIKLLPTGGITVETAADYLRAGATALGVGGELFRKDWMEAGDGAAIEQAARAWLLAVQEAR